MLLTLLSGCLGSSRTAETIEVKTYPVERPKLILPAADPVKIKDIEWVIVTRENQEEVFKKIEDSGQPVSIFGLTGDGYAKISQNLNDIRRYIEQQNAIILAYKNYYVEADKALENAVTVE
jgi:hypothetical protein